MLVADNLRWKVNVNKRLSVYLCVVLLVAWAGIVVSTVSSVATVATGFRVATFSRAATVCSVAVSKDPTVVSVQESATLPDGGKPGVRTFLHPGAVDIECNERAAGVWTGFHPGVVDIVLDKWVAGVWTGLCAGAVDIWLDKWAAGVWTGLHAGAVDIAHSDNAFHAGAVDITCCNKDLHPGAVDIVCGNTTFLIMSVQTPKEVRGSKRSGLTKRLNNLCRLVAESEYQEVKKKYEEAKASFRDFENAHDMYNSSLKGSETEVADLETSDRYFHDVQKVYIQHMNMARQFLEGATAGGAKSSVSSASYTVKLPPAPQPDVFTGRPESYPMWLASFNTLVGKHNIGGDEKMYYLKKYTGGDAQAAIESLFMCPTDASYAAALDILKQRFGKPNLVTSAFRKRIEGWPKISDTDGKGLQKFADFLTQVDAAKKSYSALSILDDKFENEKMVRKLPNWLAKKWVEQIILEGDDASFPNFDTFKDFIVEQAKIANHRLCSGAGASGGSGVSQGARSKGTSMAVNTGSSTQSKPKPCVVCEQPHCITKCPTFINMTLASRKREIMKHRLCFGCLRPGHQNSECRQKHTCAVCKRKHPTLLHDYSRDGNQGVSATGGDGPPQGVQNQSAGPAASGGGQSQSSQSQNNVTNQASRQQNQNSGNVTHSAASDSSKSVSYTTMVVPVIVSHPSSDRDMLVYALLDTQSNTHFVAHSVLEGLGLSGQDTTLDLTTMHGRKMAPTKVIENLTVRGVDSTCTLNVSRCFERESIPCSRTSIPTPASVKQWPHLSHLELPPYYDDAPVGLLIGYTCVDALRPLEVIPGSGNEPFGLKTNLGWCVVGSPCDDTPQDEIGASHIMLGSIALRTHCKEVIVPELEYCDLHSDAKYSVEDTRFLNIMSTGMKQGQDKHYVAPLPLKQGPNLPNNRALALSRLHGLRSKFVKDQSYREKYTAVMEETLESGFAEVVPQDHVQLGPKGRTWYIPHHGVPKDKDKVRVVFDCSSRYRGISINDLLLTGPDLTNALLGILLRFRADRVAFTCDVQKMYYQFNVIESDRDLLRFLWWPKGDFNQDPIDYRMTVHIFGAASSAGVATYALRKTAIDHGDKYPSAAAKFVTDDFYVDDGVTSQGTVDEACQLFTDTQGLLSEGGLKLHKVMSNSPELMKKIPESDHAPDGPDHLHKTLGVLWDVVSDELCIPLQLKVPNMTRRGILSAISAIFDPMGLVAPALLPGKLLLQELCRDSSDWDSPLPDELHGQYMRWCNVVGDLGEIRVQRCHKPDFEVQYFEIHHFADASTVGYSACSYIRYVGREGQFHVRFLLGKCRVVPLKPVLTVPRLELAAAVLASQLASVLSREYPQPAAVYFWTDSTIVLGYIKSVALRFKVYVANRVQKIHSASEPKQWGHVRSSDNPADDGSRGVLSERWLNGPEFLYRELVPPVTDVSAVIPEDDNEVCHDVQATIVPHVSVLTTQKDWFTTKKVWAWVLRFIHNSKAGNQRVRGPLVVSEIEAAERQLLRVAQSECFGPELSQVRQGKSVSPGSRLRRLAVVVDGDGLLRVGGRLRHGSLGPEVKHPVILPGDHVVTKLLINHFHQAVHHQGRGITASEVRGHGFWVVGLTRLVKRLIWSCVTCRRLRGQPQQQRMASLPAERASPSPPFLFTGCDAFGPFIVKNGRKECKRYGIVFTCLASRAVHLEVVFSLSSDSFINAFKRFVALRGYVRSLFCDQGTNFVGAARDLVRMGCEMKLNPPAASHFGGAWERMVGSARRIIEGILVEHGTQLDDEGLLTVMAETAAVINSRPLSVVDIDDPNSLEPLTPNHLVTMKSKIISKPVVPPNTERADLYALQRWKRIQYLLDLFWSRWRKEIVQMSQSRAKWNKARPNIKVDDIVLIVDEHAHRSHWKLARVTEVKKSRDDLVRSATLILPDRSTLVRPIQKLVLIARE